MLSISFFFPSPSLALPAALEFKAKPLQSSRGFRCSLCQSCLRPAGHRLVAPSPSGLTHLSGLSEFYTSWSKHRGLGCVIFRHLPPPSSVPPQQLNTSMAPVQQDILDGHHVLWFYATRQWEYFLLYSGLITFASLRILKLMPKDNYLLILL